MAPSLSLLLPLLLAAAALAAPTKLSDCGYGSFFSLSLSACKPCAPGTYNYLPYATSCTPCPANTYTPYSGVVDRSLCLPCAPDSHSAPGSSVCTRCPLGRVRATAHSSSSYYSKRHNYSYSRRLSVVPPTSNNNNNNNMCTPCTARSCLCAFSRRGCPSPVKMCSTKGYIHPPQRGVSYFPPATCVSATTGCPSGLALHKWARAAICEDAAGEVVCPKGYLYDGVDRCVRCQPGAVLRHTPKEDRKYRCEYCAGNAASVGGLVTECRKCPCGWAVTRDLIGCFNTIPKGVSYTCD